MSRIPFVPLRPVASPVDTFSHPEVRQSNAGNEAYQLAQSLAVVSGQAAALVPRLEEQQNIQIFNAKKDANTDYTRLQGTLTNQKALKDAVASGQIADGNNPWKIEQLTELVAQREARDGTQQIFQDYRDNSGLWSSDDPGAVGQYLDQSLSKLTEGRSPTELQGMASVIDEFRNSVISQHMSRRTRERSENFDAELAGKANDLGLSLAIGDDPLAASKAQNLLNQALITTDAGKANALVSQHIAEGFKQMGASGGGPDALRRALSSVTTSPGHSLADAPGSESLIADYAAHYAASVSGAQSRVEKAHEDEIKLKAAGEFSRILSQAGPNANPADLNTSVDAIQDPEVRELARDKVVAAVKNREALSASGEKQIVNSLNTKLVQALQNGQSTVSLAQLMSLHGGAAEASSTVETFNKMSATTDKNVWFDINQKHIAGTWDQDALRKYLPLIGRDKLDEAMMLADPSSPVNKRDNGESVFSDQASFYNKQLGTMSDARFNFQEFGNDSSATPGNKPEVTAAERTTAAEAIQSDYSNRLRSWMTANPNAKTGEVREAAGKIAEQVQKDNQLPTIQEITAVQAKRRAAAALSAAQTPTATTPETAKQSLTKSVETLDPVLSQFGKKDRDGVNAILSVPSAFDGQLPARYDAGDTTGSFFDRMSRIGDQIRGITLRQSTTKYGQQQAVDNFGKSREIPLQVPEGAGLTERYIGLVKNSQTFSDVSANSPELLTKFRDQALVRRDEIRQIINNDQVIPRIKELTAKIQSRQAKLGTDTVFYPEKKELTNLNNLLQEYEASTMYVGISPEEAKQIGNDAHLKFLMFGSDQELSDPKSFFAVAQKLGLKSPQQIEEFTAAQKAKLEHRNYALQQQ